MSALLAVWVAVSVQGCDAPGSQSLAGLFLRQDVPLLPDTLFEIVGRITLEESDSVINVAPIVTVQEDGSFLIADVREEAVRQYLPDGRLLWQYRRVGDGPGEIRYLVDARLRRDGTLMIADMRGIMMFDSARALVREDDLPLAPAYRLVPLSDSRTIIAGRRLIDSTSFLLHIWDHDTGGVSNSFFPTPGDDLIRAAARASGWVDVTHRNDTVAAVFGLTDTLYLYTANGEGLARVPFPIQGFRQVRSPVPAGTPADFEEWYSGLHVLVSIHWLDDGSWLLQYQRPQGADARWNLLRMTSTGGRVFDVRNMPELLAVDGDRLYFVDPYSETPDRWVVATLRDW